MRNDERGVMLRWLGIAALLGAAACDRPGGIADGCRWDSPLDTAGWARVDAGPFEFSAPPDLREHATPAAARRVGVRSNGDQALAYDYGMGVPDPRDRPVGGEESWRCETRIGGRPAVVRVGVRQVEARPGLIQRHAVAEAWWPDAGAGGKRLLLIGWGPEADSTAVQRRTLTAARTLRFH